MNRILTAFIAVSAMLFAGAACAVNGVSPNQVVIGQSITLQGGKNDYGVAVLAGVKAYLDVVNARGVWVDARSC